MSTARRLARRAAIEATMVRSGPLVPGRRPPAVRLLALLAVRDGARHVPGFLRSVGPQVDGIVAFDDGSTDGTPELLAASPHVLEVVRGPADRSAWDDVANHRRLVAAALAHRPAWLVSVDADERLERGFRVRAERVIARGSRLGLTAYAVRFRELWGDEEHFRADGIWGAKTQERLFRARADHRFDERAVHGTKVPLQARIAGRTPFADLTIWHLGMLTPAERAARRARHEALDPAGRLQPGGEGYAYLTDETGLRLRRVPRRRAPA